MACMFKQVGVLVSVYVWNTAEVIAIWSCPLGRSIFVSSGLTKHARRDACFSNEQHFCGIQGILLEASGTKAIQSPS